MYLFFFPGMAMYCQQIQLYDNASSQRRKLPAHTHTRIHTLSDCRDKLSSTVATRGTLTIMA